MNFMNGFLNKQGTGYTWSSVPTFPLFSELINIHNDISDLIVLSLKASVVSGAFVEKWELLNKT